MVKDVISKGPLPRRHHKDSNQSVGMYINKQGIKRCLQDVQNAMKLYHAHISYNLVYVQYCLHEQFNQNN